VALPASAQIKTFKWQSELCDLTGTYDSKKHTPTQLRNTLLLFGANAPRLEFNATVWKYTDIDGLDVNALDREYEQRSKLIRELDIVKVRFWRDLRLATLKELRQYHELSRSTAQAYRRPEILKDYPRAEACKVKYAEPLRLGGEKLIAAWREVNRASQEVNSDPLALQQRWDRENASPDRLQFALVETMAFGWWNCANGYIERSGQASDGTAEKEYRKLFVRVKEVCEEP
jgi:hypothetical protein